MAENTKVEWADHTFNGWIGCTRVSPACDHCYAAEMMDTRYGRAKWGPGETRVITSDENWKMPLRWNRAAAKAGIPQTVFCLSLGDIWDKEVDLGTRRRLIALMRETPMLIWLLLSKRIGNAVELSAGYLPPNVALGSTMVNQHEWDRDAPRLAAAARRLSPLFTFASVEPMLEKITPDGYCPDWVICGGESGRGARHMEPEWAAHLRVQVQARKKAFFMKQMTHKAPIPAALMVREFPPQLRRA